MYSSPLAVAAREAKKLCSKIKSQVSNFEKLVRVCELNRET
jgi:hypothetical protein